MRNKQDRVLKEPGAGEAIKFEDRVCDAGSRGIPRELFSLVVRQRARKPEAPETAHPLQVAGLLRRSFWLISFCRHITEWVSHPWPGRMHR